MKKDVGWITTVPNKHLRSLYEAFLLPYWEQLDDEDCWDEIRDAIREEMENRREK